MFPAHNVPLIGSEGKFFKLDKVDERTHTAYGMSTAEMVDRDGEIADYADTAIEYQKWSDAARDTTKAAGQEVSLGNIRLQHTTQIAGKAVTLELRPDEKQIWLQTTPVSDEIFGMLKGGFLTGFSHAGRYKYRRCNICKTDIPGVGNFCPACAKAVNVRYAPILSEVSYVDRPCLDTATFTAVKEDGSIELRKFVPGAAIVVLSDIRALAERQRQEFAQAMEDLEKAARHPTGRFALHASGAAHDLVAGYGYQHSRTGSHAQPGNDGTAAKQYTHDSGARLTVRDDGNWNHDDGHGRTASGIGLDTLRNCLMARHPKKVEANDMDDATLKKLIIDTVAEILKGGMKCPGCGSMDTKMDGDEGMAKCGSCGKSFKAPSKAAADGTDPKTAKTPEQIALEAAKGEQIMNGEELLKSAKDDLEKVKTDLAKSIDAIGPAIDGKLAPVLKALEGLTAVTDRLVKVEAFGERLTKLEALKIDALTESVTKLETTLSERLTKVEAFGERLTKAEEEVKKIGEEAAPLVGKAGGLQLFSRDGKQFENGSASDNGDDRSGGL